MFLFRRYINLLLIYVVLILAVWIIIRLRVDGVRSIRSNYFLSASEISVSGSKAAAAAAAGAVGSGKAGPNDGVVFASSIPSKKKYRIVMCSKLGDEVPYVLEWMEFHRLQGIDKFVLYHSGLPGSEIDTRQALELQLVKSLYEEIGLTDIVDVFPAYLIHPDVTANGTQTASLHRSSQIALLGHCMNKYKYKADWIANIDGDEFLFGNPTLWDFLNAEGSIANRIRGKIAGPISGHHMLPQTFGVSDSVFTFNTKIILNPVLGKTVVYYDPRDSKKGAWTKRRDAKLGNQNTTTLVSQIFPYLSHGVESTQKVEVEVDDLNIWKFYNEIDTLANCTEISEMFDFYTRQLEFGKDLSIWDEEIDLDYPLIIEKQTNRIPHQEDYRSDDLRTKFFGEWFNKQNKFKDVFHSCNFMTPESEFFSKNGPQSSLCESGHPFPPWITTAGKTIYKSDSIEGVDLNVALPAGACIKPWIHNCIHKVMPGRIITHTKYDADIFLHHHQWRSVEHRTIRLPKWRLKNCGFISEINSIGWMRVVDLIKDVSKQKMGKLIRQNIMKQFHPQPRLWNISLHMTDSNSTQSSETLGDRSVVKNMRGILNVCSPYEILNKLSCPCPKNKPYAGHAAIDAQPPHMLQPYHYCSEFEIPYHLTTTGPNNNSFQLCPCWAKLPCCTSIITHKNQTVFVQDILHLYEEKNKKFQHTLHTL